MEKSLSVVIPVYNEEMRLKKNFLKIVAFFEKNLKDYELIFVNDGSKDDTRKIIEQKKSKRIILLQNKKNMGKGYSVKKGMLKARKNFVLFMDCDLSTPLYEVKNFFKIARGYDLIIGSRNLKNSKVKMRKHKRFLGKISNFFISQVIKDIRDTQCGFKFFKKKIVKKLFSKQTINRWGFDFEILYLAQKYNLKIKEHPITWVENKESKVKILDYPRTFLDLIKVKANDIKRKY